MKTIAEAVANYVTKNVVVFLVNGFQLRGIITEVYEDGGVRLIDNENHEANTIYGNVISTIREVNY